MSLGVVLYNASYWLPLTDPTSGFGVNGLNIGEADIRRVFTKPFQRGYDPLVAISWGNRTIRLPINITGTSVDNWSDNYQAIQTVLIDTERYQTSRGKDGAQAWLAVQLDGQTNPVVYDVLGGDTAAADAQYSKLDSYTFTTPAAAATLFCRPFGHHQARTSVASGNLQSGVDTYTLPAVDGNWESPLRITFQPGLPYRRVILCKRTRGTPSALPWPIECEASGTGYAITLGSNVTNVVLAGASNGRVARHTNATSSSVGVPQKILTVKLNANIADLAGTYQVWLRGMNSVSVYTSCQLRYGGPNGDAVQVPKITTGIASRVTPLGLLPIPQAIAAGQLMDFSFSIWAEWTVSGFPPDANNLFDAIYLMPVDEGLVDVDLDAQSVAADKLVVDALSFDSTIFNLNSNGDFSNRIISINNDWRAQVTPGKESRWFALWGQGASSSTEGAMTQHLLSGNATLTFLEEPLWDLSD